MSLSSKQRNFVRMVGLLIEHAYQQGYELTFGDAYRDPRLHGEMGKKGGYGAPNSCHKIRLAVDFNLFKDGKYLTATDDYLPLGLYWESIGGSWGGRFKGGDGNHFSLEHEGFR